MPFSFFLTTEAVESWRKTKLHEAKRLMLGDKNLTLEISLDDAGRIPFSEHAF